MAADFKVYAIQLLNSKGKVYCDPQGLEDELSPIEFDDGEEHTIERLKARIVDLYFPNSPRPLGRIKVYSYPAAASASSQQQQLASHTVLDEALERGKSYGFIEAQPPKITIPVVTEVSRRKVPVSADDAGFARLTKEGMPKIYVSVASSFKADPGGVNHILEKIEEIQDMDYDELPAPFVCVFDSSGTGKTQLAATTTLLRSNCNTTYFYVGEADYENTQKFYRPHWHLWQVLKPLVIDFCNDINEARTAEVPGAGKIFLHEGKHPLIQSLHNIFLRTDNDTTISELREAIQSNTSRNFVFLDEIPPAESNSKNFAALALRNVLRAVGLVPILMSTHSGAHNAIPTGADSRGPEDNSLWCLVFTKLPPKVTPNVDCSYDSRNERPLISQILTELTTTERSNLLVCVSKVRETLMKTKRGAWTKTPTFQLCQLLRSTKDAKNRNLCSHRLVGEHFGHFVGGADGCVRIERQVPHLEGKIRMPEAEREPILFLALTSWSTATLNEDFPLLNSAGDPISVRDAFELCKKEFCSRAFIDNPASMKTDGNLMEALAMASMTLASLRTDGGMYNGVPMLQFIATVFCFLLSNVGGLAKGLEEAISSLKSFNDEEEIKIPHVTEIVPPCAAAGSAFSNDVFSVRGGLKRPADRERRDGALDILDDRIAKPSTLIQVECKNYSSGLDTSTLEDVITRMRHGVKVTFLFTSKMKGVWQKGDAHDDFFAKLDLVEGEVCLLYLRKGKNPTWVETLNGTLLKPSHECKYLLVVFGVDAFDASS